MWLLLLVSAAPRFWAWGYYLLIPGTRLLRLLTLFVSLAHPCFSDKLVEVEERLGGHDNMKAFGNPNRDSILPTVPCMNGCHPDRFPASGDIPCMTRILHTTYPPLLQPLASHPVTNKPIPGARK